MEREVGDQRASLFFEIQMVGRERKNKSIVIFEKIALNAEIPIPTEFEIRSCMNTIPTATLKLFFYDFT